MADRELCADIVKYTNRVINLSRPGVRQPQLRAASMELFEIMACQITGEPHGATLIRAYREHDEEVAGSRYDPGLNLPYLCSMRRQEIPLLVAYELCHKRGLLEQLDPQVGWGHWLNQFHALTGMIAQPHDSL